MKAKNDVPGPDHHGPAGYRRPAGWGTAQREVVLHPGGVAILALDEADNVALVRQYRYPLHGLLLELPAGKLDPGRTTAPPPFGS